MRLGVFYAAIFVAMGVHLPFWPVWLKAQGLSDTEVGLVVGVGMGARVIANPLVAHWVERKGQLIYLMRLLAAVSLILCALFAVVNGFWSLLILSATWLAIFTAIMPLGESLTLFTAYARRLDYGRIRLWGSLSFMMASMVGGVLLADHSPAVILWILMIGMVLTLVACLLIEDIVPSTPSSLHSAAFRQVLADSRYWLFLASASLINASHNIYYSFATLHWQRAGISPIVIGGLWAEAVMAEVLLFAFSNTIVAWLRPIGLLILGGGAAMIRWLVLGSSTHLMVLIAAQLLHAFTFGAIHIGAMHFLTCAVPPEASARAQAVYGSVSMGAAVGLATMVAGPLYQALAGQAFHISAGLAVLGSLLAARLYRRWQGELLGS
ncbi:Probable 3-phenylpropionic acid transporter |uniref:Probable 3-phenylpropionic acid transporter \